MLIKRKELFVCVCVCACMCVCVCVCVCTCMSAPVHPSPPLPPLPICVACKLGQNYPMCGMQAGTKLPHKLGL